MLYIRETCPKCGEPLINTEIAVCPPIPRKECPKCGWSWEGEAGKIIDVPFNLGIGKGTIQSDKSKYSTNIDSITVNPISMRDATVEESKSTRDYIRSISYKTDVNIFDLINSEDKEETYQICIIYGDSKGDLHSIFDPDSYRLYDNGRVIEFYKNKINYTVCSDYIEIIEKED